jgi:hypothetical protein
MLMSPQLTEDDHIQGLFELRYIVPPEWENMIMGWLRTRPVLCVGVSALDWRHRMLLRWLFDQRPPPVGSLAVLAEARPRTRSGRSAAPVCRAPATSRSCTSRPRR